MRERRHLSGSSNMPRPVSAREPGSPPLRAPRSGAKTARRAETDSQSSNERARNLRRIHSARTERPQAIIDSTPEEARAPVLATKLNLDDGGIRGVPVLPHLTVNPLTLGQPQVQWAVKVVPNEPSSGTTKHPTASVMSASSSNSPSVPTHLQPVLQDFSALLRDRYEGKRSLRIAFLNWDRDKDGQLSVQEIRDMINTLGFAKKLGKASVDAILDHVAARPSQSLRYEDFCLYVHGPPRTNPVEEPPKPTTENIAIAASDPRAHDQPLNSDVVLSSDRALYPDVAHVVAILRKKYETRKLRQVFRHWDADKDGCITINELDLNLRRQGVKLPSDQLRELFDKHDLNKDGRLLYQEFVEMIFGPVTVEHHNPALRAHLREVTKQENQPPDAYQIFRNSTFNDPVGRIDEQAICATVQEKLKVFAPRIHDAYTAFDDDHNGNLSYSEFRDGLNMLGLHFTEREFLHLASMVDTDGSGEICFREFRNLFTRHSTKENYSATGSRNPSLDDPTLAAKQQTKLSQGSFDFSHLTRRSKGATRHGRTPYNNTKDLLSPTNEENAQNRESQRFRTEASLYGSGQPLRHHPGSRVGPGPMTSSLTLGQEEKQRKEFHYVKRLERIRAAQHEYDERRAPLQDAYDAMQQRRLETLNRQQHRYHTSVDEHQPHGAKHSPLPRRTRESTLPPYVTQ